MKRQDQRNVSHLAVDVKISHEKKRRSRVSQIRSSKSLEK